VVRLRLRGHVRIGVIYQIILPADSARPIREEVRDRTVLPPAVVRVEERVLKTVQLVVRAQRDRVLVAIQREVVGELDDLRADLEDRCLAIRADEDRCARWPSDLELRKELPWKLSMIVGDREARDQAVGGAVAERALELRNRAVRPVELREVLASELRQERRALEGLRRCVDEVVPDVELVGVAQIEVEPTEQLRALGLLVEV